MKQNVVLLLATFVLIIVCAIAVINPKQAMAASHRHSTTNTGTISGPVLDGGGGVPVPPCGTLICP